MKTKDLILDFLKRNTGSYISGQRLAEELNISRAAVWKAINSLKNDGLNIEGVTNKGYRIVTGRLKVFNYNEAASTNDLAKEFALSHPDTDAVFVADCQTKGRGRRGRSFFSPGATGLYMSLLIHPKADASKTAHLTCLAGAAVCDAIEEACGIQTQIKWVNDIYYRNKKICGILTEGQASLEDGLFSYVIVGIGINLCAPEGGFPDDIKNKAGALFKDCAPNGSVSDIKIMLCNSIIKNFFKYYNSSDEKSFLSRYKERSMLIGKHVEILSHSRKNMQERSSFSADTDENQNPRVLVTGIDDDCRLVVRYPDGTTAALSSGEVSAAPL